MISGVERAFHVSEATDLFIEPVSTMQWAKLIGAIAGSIISVAYILPRSRREAALRMCVGLVTGFIFGGTAGVQIAGFLGLIGKISVFEITLSGAALSSLSAWWSLGALQRVVEQWSPGKNSLFRKKTNKEDDAQ